MNQLVKTFMLCTVAIAPVYSCSEKSSKKDKVVDPAQLPENETGSEKPGDTNTNELEKERSEDTSKKEGGVVEGEGSETAPTNSTEGTATSGTDSIPAGPIAPVVTPNEPVVTPDEPVVTPSEPVVIPSNPVVPVDPGLAITTNTPLVTQIDPNVQPTTDWIEDQEFNGREYWLYSTRRPQSLMTFDAEANYQPYGQASGCEGVPEGADSPCNLKPSNVAKECQRIASKTLKAIMETENEAMTLLKEIELKYSTPSDGFIPFGWLNDAYSDRKSGTTNAPQDLFIWRSNKQNVRPGSCPRDFKSVSIEDWAYIKWVSSVTATGECRTPTLGQFMTLLKAARKCLEDNNAGGN